MIKIVMVGVGGFIGAIARYGLSGMAQRHFNSSFPAGTLAVNVIGCFIIGSLMVLVEDRQFFTPNARLFLMVGILGAFTTFSTFGYETFELMRDWNLRLVAWNVVLNVALGLAAVWSGRAATKILGV